MDESEKRALGRLRRIERQWPTARWLLLGLGIFNILNGALSYFLHHDQSFGVAVGFIGLFAFTIAIRDWHGNASRKLLLKLYKEQ